MPIIKSRTLCPPKAYTTNAKENYTLGCVLTVLDISQWQLLFSEPMVDKVWQ